MSSVFWAARYWGTVTRMISQTTSEMASVTSMTNARISAPMTINGQRSKRRSVMFTPFCSWFTSLVMRVTSVGVPMPSSSV